MLFPFDIVNDYKCFFWKVRLMPSSEDGKLGRRDACVQIAPLVPL